MTEDQYYPGLFRLSEFRKIILFSALPEKNKIFFSLRTLRVPP
jgi:hypothetical protein